MSQTLNIFLIAGEPSGDKLGGALMAGLKQLSNPTFAGVGGPSMEEQGLNSLFPMSDLSVMGLLEVLPRVPRLLRRVRETTEAVVAANPDVLITIDSPDFCFRVAAKLKERLPDLKVVHYVAPSVWAWRPERAEKMARYVDHVLALLPFEPPYMTAAGMTCDFVGHPLVSESIPNAEQVEALGQELGLDLRSDKIICLLPGSRVGEIKRMAPIYGEVMRRVAAQVPEARFILPVSAAVVDEVRRMTQSWPVKPVLLDPTGLSVEDSEFRKRTAFHLSYCALATSGTVALELAAADCPMVVAYKANYLTTRMVKKLAQVDTANLINIVTESRVIPEFLFENCTVDKITPALLSLVTDNSAHAEQQNACRTTVRELGLGQEDPGVRAARSVLGFIEQNQ